MSATSERPDSAEIIRKIIDTINPLFIQKLVDKWSLVRKAFRTVDQDHSGSIDKGEFAFLVKREFNLPMSDADIERIFNLFDDNESGLISYDEFNKKVGVYVHGKKGDSHGIIFEGSLKEDVIRPHAPIKGLPPNIIWNNRWRQELSTPGGSSNEEKTRMKRLVEGDYYCEPVANQQATSMLRLRGRQQEWDEDCGIPKVQSVIAGMYYGGDGPSAEMVRKIRRKNALSNDFIRRNRKLMTTYSSMLSQTRPMQEPSEAPSSSHKQPFFGLTPRNRTHTGRKTPSDVVELEKMVGCKMDENIAKSTVEWLSLATPRDKCRFKRMAPFLKANYMQDLVRLQGGLTRDEKSVLPRVVENENQQPPAAMVENGNSAPLVPRPPSSKLTPRQPATPRNDGETPRNVKRLAVPTAVAVNMNQAWQRVSYGCSWASPRLQIIA